MMTLRFAFAAAAALLLGAPVLAAETPDKLVIAEVTGPAVQVTLPPATEAPPTGDAPSAPASELAAPEAMPVIGRAQVAPVEPLVEPLDAPPAPKYRDLWERIRAGFMLPELDSPLVARHEAWYLNRPEYVQRMIERSHRYLYFIVDELEKRNMPTEIALLPMIESAYNPQAYSRARASGIWQFIPSTGRKYGLQQNFWYDGRRDVLAATHAALDYLQFLHDMFGDWELALASYNWGEGAVSRAIAKNQARGLPTDYVSLTMPNET